MPQLSLAELRQKHPRFVYETVHFEVIESSLIADFYFRLEPNIRFTSRFIFHNTDLELFSKLDQSLIRYWLFCIGMVEGLSYWKAACSPEFVVTAGFLDESQIAFFQKLLQNGLSEFFFVNQIDGWQKDFVKIFSEVLPMATLIDKNSHQERAFVPVGGGKDSLVSLELLKKMGFAYTTFTLNATHQVEELLKVVGTQQTLSVTRQLDPQILELNAQGYFNGHTPFSALLSFVATFTAYLFDCKYVVLSNEQSANEGNTLFLGKMINHQYSKSYEYEKDFREFVRKYLSETIEYFSLLRPLHEIQIAKIFAHYPQYFSYFLSCNRGQKTGKWCGECPKCLFVYIMLSPFLSETQLVNIFGQNLLAKSELKPILAELTGEVECKSLECVGTREETLAALHFGDEEYGGKKLLGSFSPQNFLPKPFIEALKKEIETT